jgi:hypothetical protein
MLNADAQVKTARKRRVWKLVLRYGLVVVTVGAVGAGTAYALTIPKRTDIPTLKTKSDGRYDFGALTQPALPPGVLAMSDPGDKGHVHGADIRTYLLPAPKGATLDPKYPAEGGWVTTEDFGKGFDTPDAVEEQLAVDGVRHIAARAWTTPDGQHTTIMVLQFPDETAAADYMVADPGGSPFGFDGDDGAPGTVAVRDIANDQRPVDLHRYGSLTPPAVADSQQNAGFVGRIGMWEAGDTVVVVTTAAPKGVTDVPTIQVIQLQAELLN